MWFKTPTIVDTQRQPLLRPQPESSPRRPPAATAATDSKCETTSGGHTTQYLCVQHTCVGPCDNRLLAAHRRLRLADQPRRPTDTICHRDHPGRLLRHRPQDREAEVPRGARQYEAAWQALPGKFDSLFVYTYSAPTNLYVGDHLLTLTGSVQEFSGDTQLDFPAWLKVDADPTPDLGAQADPARAE